MQQVLDDFALASTDLAARLQSAQVHHHAVAQLPIFPEAHAEHRAGGGIGTGRRGLLVRLLAIQLHVLGVDVDDGLAQQTRRLLHVFGPHHRVQMQAGQRFRQPDHRLELAHGDAVGGAAAAAAAASTSALGQVVGPQLLVVLHQQVARLGRDARLQRAGEPNIPLQLLGAQLRLNGLALMLMQTHNIARDVVVADLVAIVQNHEEQVETRHDRRRHLQIAAQRLGAVVATADRIGRRQHRGARVQGGLNARLGDGDGLLLHGLVNGHLIAQVHLVEFVDATDTIIGQHQRARLDAKLAGLAVLQHRGGQAGRRRRLARGVDRARHEAADVLEELRFGGGRVAHDAHVDIAAEVDVLGSAFVHAAEQHQEQGALDVIVPEHGGRHRVHHALVEARQALQAHDLVALGSAHVLQQRGRVERLALLQQRVTLQQAVAQRLAVKHAGAGGRGDMAGNKAQAVVEFALTELARAGRRSVGPRLGRRRRRRRHSRYHGACAPHPVVHIGCRRAVPRRRQPRTLHCITGGCPPPRIGHRRCDGAARCVAGRPARSGGAPDIALGSASAGARCGAAAPARPTPAAVYIVRPRRARAHPQDDQHPQRAGRATAPAPPSTRASNPQHAAGAVQRLGGHRRCRREFGGVRAQATGAVECIGRESQTRPLLVTLSLQDGGCWSCGTHTGVGREAHRRGRRKAIRCCGRAWWERGRRVELQRRRCRRVRPGFST
eukprot:ctg_786.g159